MAIPSISALADMPLVGSSIPTKPAAQAAATPDFSSVLAEMASHTVSDVRTGEQMALKGIQGQAPVQEVVQAVMQAQTSLQTALAIRDKVITAYQELIRMPI
jgi:flagellar hook-basal body complex protein FliE